MRSILEEQVEEYLNPKPGFRLRRCFPRELQTRFEVEQLEHRVRQVTFTGLLATVFYDLFLFADYAKHPSVIWRCIVLRLCVATPVVLVSVLAVRRRARAAIREWLLLASVSIAGGIVLAVSYDLNRMDSMFSQLGFMLIVFFGSLILRQPFSYAIATLGLMLLEDVVFIVSDRWMTADDKVTSFFIVVASILLTLVASFIMENQERTSFAHVLKESFHSKALAELNQKLTGLSQVDGLTGLSNRRHFEERFEAMWDEAVNAGSALSLVMMDIDHFKRLNDTFGHIAGDGVLIQMGQILTACTRTREDVVARFGGEEFILLLAGAGHEEAHGIADELRRIVSTSVTGPKNEEETQRSVTVSCGLATIVPTASDDRLKLIAEADLALYAAKREGRDRVSCGMCEAAVPERYRQAKASDLSAVGLEMQGQSFSMDLNAVRGW